MMHQSVWPPTCLHCKQPVKTKPQPSLFRLCFAFSKFFRAFKAIVANSLKMPPTKQAALQCRRGGKRNRKLRLTALRRAACAPKSPEESLSSIPNSSTSPSSGSPMPLAAPDYPMPGNTSATPSTIPDCSDSVTTPSVDHASATQLQTSASSSKLERFSTMHEDVTFQTLPTAIVDLNCLQPLFMGYKCSNCRDGNFTLSRSGMNSGMVLRLTLVCTVCNFSKPPVYTSPRLPDSSFAINRATVASSLAAGFGLSGLKKFSESMNMPILSEPSFQEHCNKLYKNISAFKKETLDRSVCEVRKAYRNDSHPNLGENEILDITVSYDGSWHTRGHKSKNGLGCVIDIKTGLVVDYHVMSTFCKICETVGVEVRKKGEFEYDEWMKEHKSVCMKNFNSTAGAMEVEAALVCWERSQERGLRYVKVVSDGDCKTIKKINELKPYGPVEVQKEECINHVAKRLGKALRDLVETKKKQKITLGGRGEGKLTQVKIGKLQKYYTKAIRSSKTLEGMQEAVMATFFHCTSTDDKPQHSSCPDGFDSWCFFKRAEERGDVPPSHKEKLSCFLSPEVAEHVLDVYKRLSSCELMSRCLSGQSQNRNESLHSLIWSRCPKHIFVNRKRLETSLSVAIGEFNEGSIAYRRFSNIQGLQLGEFTVKLGEKRDRRRKYFANYVAEETCKARRKIRADAKRKEELDLIDQEIEREGGLLYEAGGDI